MTARLQSTWKPGQPLPKRANRLTIQSIIEHEYGATVGSRFVEILPVKPKLIGGQNVWPVDAVLKAVRTRAA
ncbi:hypothetical protein [Tropicimonas sp. IMCC6043]|uniref:hypothetical protein n=1 Tax=Tropicimonas sp. IMCC6043 TaxID=2510645 RepID=UPI00101DF80D|nr:hypothetical protein [Tropicimonas sp. IMCC6043]RYH06117.1 hypothetical protein EU800_24945 [Tropicimonas sp. IMCC6043]